MAKLFFSYAHEDEAHRDELEKHLASLKDQGLIECWHDRRLTPGTDFAVAIDGHLVEADVVLLLVSSSFLASKYCHGIEMQRALDRRKAGECIVVPVVVRPCDWKHPPLSELVAAPTDGKAVTEWANYDAAMTDVARLIRRALTKPPGQDATAPVERRTQAPHGRPDSEEPLPVRQGSGSSLDPLAGLVRVVRTTYVCYVSISKLDTLEASLVAAGALPSDASHSPELTECLRRVDETATFGRPDRHGLRSAMKAAALKRLQAVLVTLKPHITDFNWGTGDQRRNRYYYTRADFSVAETYEERDIITLHAERDGFRLMLDCSLQYFSHRLGDEDGKAAGGSELSSFMRRRSALTMGTIFILLSQPGPTHLIGSPLFLELDSGVGVDI